MIWELADGPKGKAWHGVLKSWWSRRCAVGTLLPPRMKMAPGMDPASSAELYNHRPLPTPPLPTSFTISARCSSSEEKCLSSIICWTASVTSLLCLRIVSNTVLSGAVTERKGGQILSQTMGILFSLTSQLHSSPRHHMASVASFGLGGRRIASHCSQNIIMNKGSSAPTSPNSFCLSFDTQAFVCPATRCLHARGCCAMFGSGLSS